MPVKIALKIRLVVLKRNSIKGHVVEKIEKVSKIVDYLLISPITPY